MGKIETLPKDALLSHSKTARRFLQRQSDNILATPHINVSPCIDAPEERNLYTPQGTLIHFRVGGIQSNDRRCYPGKRPSTLELPRPHEPFGRVPSLLLLRSPAL